jgi:hypothetical protein
VLAVTSLGVFIVLLDTTIINIAGYMFAAPWWTCTVHQPGRGRRGGAKHRPSGDPGRGTCLADPARDALQP